MYANYTHRAQPGASLGAVRNEFWPLTRRFVCRLALADFSDISWPSSDWKNSSTSEERHGSSITMLTSSPSSEPLSSLDIKSVVRIRLHFCWSLVSYRLFLKALTRSSSFYIQDRIDYYLAMWITFTNSGLISEFCSRGGKYIVTSIKRGKSESKGEQPHIKYRESQLARGWGKSTPEINPAILIYLWYPFTSPPSLLSVAMPRLCRDSSWHRDL